MDINMEYFPWSFLLCAFFLPHSFSVVSFHSSSSIGSILGHWLQSNGHECVCVCACVYNVHVLVQCLRRFDFLVQCANRNEARIVDDAKSISSVCVSMVASQPTQPFNKCSGNEEKYINYISEHVNYMQTPCKYTLTLPIATSYFFSFIFSTTFFFVHLLIILFLVRHACIPVRATYLEASVCIIYWFLANAGYYLKFRNLFVSKVEFNQIAACCRSNRSTRHSCLFFLFSSSVSFVWYSIRSKVKKKIKSRVEKYCCKTSNSILNLDRHEHNDLP